MDNFDLVKKIYFLGIGGIGVSAIAKMFLLEGKMVSGSDTSDSSISENLKNEGAQIFVGQSIDLIPEDTDLVIYSIAIEKFAPEFLDIVRQKFGQDRVISYPEALSIISKNKYTIAICGTHGKTTTTAMIAKIMIDAGLDPTVIVGSILVDYKTNFIVGKPNHMNYLVVEACEYQRSFLKINPNVIAITSIDADHLDYYKNIDDIVSAFKEFRNKLPQDFSCVVGDLSQPKIKEVAFSRSGRMEDSNEFFDNNLVLKVPGEHNRRNASVALAIADFLSIDKKSAIESLKNFSGTWRRFEYKGKIKNGAVVYDDYAHHPTEIEVTIKGAREAYPDKNITVVFQPHLFSRTKVFVDGFANSLAHADYVILAPIYPAREEFDSSISSDMIAQKIAVKNDNVVSLDNFEEIKKEIEESSNENDVVIIMGAGDIVELSQKLVYEE